MDSMGGNWGEKEDLLKRCVTAEERVKTIESELQKADAYQKEIQKLQAENAILEGRIQKFSQEIALKNQQIDELFKKWESSDLNLIYKENQELARKVKAREENIGKLEAQLQRLYNDFTQKNQKIVELTMTLQERNHAYFLVQKEHDQLKKLNEELESEIERSQSQQLEQFPRTIYEREITHYKKGLLNVQEKYEREQEKLQEEMNKLETLSRIKEDQIRKLNQELAQLNETVSKEQEKFQNEIKDVEVLSTKKESEKESEIQKLKRELHQAAAKSSLTSSQLENSQKEVAEQVARLAILEDELKRMREISRRSDEAQRTDRAKFISRICELEGELEKIKTNEMAAASSLPEELLKPEGSEKPPLSLNISKEEGLPEKPPLSLNISKEEGLPEGPPPSLKLFKEGGLPDGLPPSLKLFKEGGLPDGLPEGLTPINRETVRSVIESIVASETASDLPSVTLETAEDRAAGPGTGGTMQSQTITAEDATGLPVASGAVLARGFMPRASGDPKGRPLTKILVVESNPEIMQRLTQALRDEGYAISSSMDGSEALDSVQRELPSLIVMNVAIDGLDSYAVCRELVQEPMTQKIPVILIASNPETTAIFKENPKNAVKSCLYRPFSKAEFLSAVHNVIATFAPPKN